MIGIIVTANIVDAIAFNPPNANTNMSIISRYPATSIITTSTIGFPITSDSVRISPSRIACASVGVIMRAFTAGGSATIKPATNENENTIMIAGG